MPTCVHSQPRYVTRSGLWGSPATALHCRTASFVSRQCWGEIDSAWSLMLQKSRPEQKRAKSHASAGGCAPSPWSIGRLRMNASAENVVWTCRSPKRICLPAVCGCRAVRAATAGALGREAVLTFEGDVSEPDACERAVAETVARFSRLDILLNSAGTGAIGRVWELDPLLWDRVLAVNLRGTFLLTRAATRWMVEHERPGRVINIASTNATVPTTGHSPYCASKAGVVALTQVAALELAPRQVTVNAIAPGPVDTNLTAPLFAMAGAREEFLRHIPLGRVGRAEDIAQMILFLASDAAEWVTGQCFYVDGGQSLVALPPYIDLVERLLGAT